MIEIFEGLDDSRDIRGRRHQLIDIITMSIYAILSGNTDCENIADWLELRQDYFINLLGLENGTPSADTLLRVFRTLNPDQFCSDLRFVEPFRFNFRGSLQASGGFYYISPNL